MGWHTGSRRRKEKEQTGKAGTEKKINAKSHGVKTWSIPEARTENGEKGKEKVGGGDASLGQVQDCGWAESHRSARI